MYVIFSSKLSQVLFLSAISIFNDLPIVPISEPPPPLTLTTSWQSFMYSFGHYSMGRTT